MIQNRLTYYSMGVSLVAHAIVFLVLGLTVDFTPVSIKLGDADDKLNHGVVAYIFNQSVAPLMSKPLVHKSADIALSNRNVQKRQKKDVASVATNSSKPSEVSGSVGATGEKTSELVALLHAAIQAKQRYPASALQIGQEGRVNLMFILYKNGSISDLRVARSSGTDSLDQAALVAVKEAVPFKGADKYLQASQEYSIEVVFELTG